MRVFGYEINETKRLDGDGANVAGEVGEFDGKEKKGSPNVGSLFIDGPLRQREAPRRQTASCFGYRRDRAGAGPSQSSQGGEGGQPAAGVIVWDG